MALFQCFWPMMKCGRDEEAMVSYMRNLERRATIRRASMPRNIYPLKKIRSERWQLVEDLGIPKSPTQEESHKRPSLRGAANRLIASMRIGKSNFSVEKARRLLLSDWLKEMLIPFLPYRLKGSEWTKIFSTEEDGELSHAYHCCAQHPGPSVLLVMDTHRHIFGAFVDTTWELQPRLHYFGNGECFLFRALPEFEAYRWSRDNGHFMLATKDSIALGGGGHFGLWLDGELEHGSSHECSTFNNAPLAGEEEFEVVAVEIWAFKGEGLW